MVKLDENAELIGGTVKIPVEFTAEQYKWLKDLADDLRSDFSAAPRLVFTTL